MTKRWAEKVPTQLHRKTLDLHDADASSHQTTDKTVICMWDNVKRVSSGFCSQGGADPSALCFFFFICKTLFRLYYASMKASELGGANKTCIIWIVQPNSWRAARGWRCDVFPFYAQCCEVVSSLQSNIFIYTFFHLKSNKLNIVHHLMWIYLSCVKQKQKQTSAKIQAKRVKWGEHFWSVVESSY